MKNGRNGIRSSVLFFGLAAAPVAFAVERPAKLDEKPHQLKNAPAAIEPLDEEAAQNWPKKKIAIVDAVPRKQGAVAAPVPYFGVRSIPIDALLSGHLGIEHGVVIQQISPGSGAEKAGLLLNDILLSLGERKITSPLDLRDAMQNHEVGDEVTVSLIRKGQKLEEVVTLKERPEGLANFVPPGRRGKGQLHQVWPNGGFAQMDRLRDMIDEEFNGIGLGLKLNEMLEGNLPDGAGQIDMDMNAESSVTWSDGHGTITMKMKNGETEALVRGNNGEVVYDGPWETPQDKAAVDPAVRERIETMGVQKKGNQLKFWMEGLPGR